jgi:hypothetical protein
MITSRESYNFFLAGNTSEISDFLEYFAPDLEKTPLRKNNSIINLFSSVLFLLGGALAVGSNVDLIWWQFWRFLGPFDVPF